MSLQAGKDMLLKVADAAMPTGYRTIAGLRAKSLAFAAKTIDATSADSDGNWRELLAGVGLKEATIAAQGVFRDSVSQSLLQQAFFEQAALHYQLVFPGFGTLNGSFVVSALEYAGNYDAEATFSLTLSSAGALSLAQLP